MGMAEENIAGFYKERTLNGLREIIRKHIGLNPILMLDDLFDKVDESRVRQILHWLLENHIGQAFITDTHPTRIPELLKSMHFSHQVYAVEDGKIHQPEMAI